MDFCSVKSGAFTEWHTSDWVPFLPNGLTEDLGKGNGWGSVSEGGLTATVCLPWPCGCSRASKLLKADSCALPPEKVLCHTRALPGAWVIGQSAGGCRNNSCFPCNPKFWLRLLEPSEVCAAVLQRPRRCLLGQTRSLLGASPAPENLPSKDYQAVGLHIWKVTPSARPMEGRQAEVLEAWVPGTPHLWLLIPFPMSSGCRHL